MGFPFGGRCQNLRSYWVCEILKKIESELTDDEWEELRNLVCKVDWLESNIDDAESRAEGLKSEFDGE